MSSHGYGAAINRFFATHALWVIVGLGLALRLAVLAFMSDQPLTDSATYLSAARDLLSGNVFGSELVMPLYPLQAAIVGANPLALKLTDILLSTLSIWLVHGIAQFIFKDEAVALLSALAAAIHPTFLFYAATGLTETSYVFLILLGFYLLFVGRLTLGAAVLVLSILSRPSLEPLLPFLLVTFAIVVHRLSWKTAALLVAKAALIYLALMTPWWVHNHIKYDQFVRLNLGDGRMLYMGNNPLNKSGGGIEGVDVDMTRFYTDITDPVVRNNAMKAEALDFIGANPGHFLELAGLKFLRLWRMWPYAPEYQAWHVVAVSLASYGLALVLAVAFLIRHGAAHWRALAPVLLFAAFLSVVHMVTLGSMRYRLPLEPFVLMMASAMAIRLLPVGWRHPLFLKPTPGDAAA